MTPEFVAAVSAGLVLVIGTLTTSFIRIHKALRRIEINTNSNLHTALQKIDELNTTIKDLQAKL